MQQRPSLLYDVLRGALNVAYDHPVGICFLREKIRNEKEFL